METAPRLPDGTPFPTLYYLTCPRATGAVGTLEASGLMREMQDRLATEPSCARGLPRRARGLPRRRRSSWPATSPRSTGISAGGMPDRVKCLHVLVGHALAAGPGVNPLGDEALALLPDVVGRRALRRRAGERRAAVSATRVAAIDCGTNSIRLLVADVDPAAGTLVDVDRRMEIVRLGEGVDRTGRLSRRGAGAHLRRLRATTPTVVARARGRADPVRRDLGLPRRGEPRRLRRRGARARWASSPRSSPATRRPRSPSPAPPASCSARRPSRPFLVVDIGGGSTEFVLGDDAVRRRRASVDVGCVRITERHLRSDPPTAERDRRRTRGHRGRASTQAQRPCRSAQARTAGRPRRLGDHGRGDRTWA